MGAPPAVARTLAQFGLGFFVEFQFAVCAGARFFAVGLVEVRSVDVVGVRSETRARFGMASCTCPLTRSMLPSLYGVLA